VVEEYRYFAELPEHENAPSNRAASRISATNRRLLTNDGLKSGAMNSFRPSLFAFFLAITTAIAFLISSLQAATAQHEAVLAPVMALFDGMAKRNPQGIRKPLLAGGTMVLMRDGKPTQMTFEAFAVRAGRPGATHIEERIHNPLVRIDHDLAVVWAPFEFLIEGKVDHCGTDLFNLIRIDGKWLIASIADTGRKNCS
jgi:putative lumazine-binding protein